MDDTCDEVDNDCDDLLDEDAAVLCGTSMATAMAMASKRVLRMCLAAGAMSQRWAIAMMRDSPGCHG